MDEKTLLQDLVNECHYNEMNHQPYKLNYILDSSLTEENKSEHTVTECVKIWCDDQNIELDKTISLDVTTLLAGIMNVKYIYRKDDSYLAAFYPITHKDNEKLKDVCDELTRNIVRTAENNGFGNLFQKGCTVMYRA